MFTWSWTTRLLVIDDDQIKDSAAASETTATLNALVVLLFPRMLYPMVAVCNLLVICLSMCVNHP
eukprot:6182557-Pleurochrysis_carterae.AAC.8